MRNILRSGTIFILASLAVATGMSATRTCTVSGNWSEPSIWSGGAVPTFLDDVTIRNGATVTVDIDAACGGLTLGGTGSADGGILVIPSTYHILDVNGVVVIGTSTNAGVLSMVNGGLIVRGGMYINLGGLLATGGFVQYASTIGIYAASATYNVLSITTGSVSSTGPIVVNSDFSISTAATFNAGSDSIHLKGNWACTGTFNAGTGKVILDGSSPATVSSSSPFYHLTIGGTGTKTAQSALTVSGDLSINAGATFDGGNFTHTIGRDWSNLGSFLPGLSTVKLNSIGVQRIDGTTTFHHLVMTGGGPKNEYATLTVEGNLTVDAGTEFHGNGFAQHFRGNVTLNGSFDVNIAAVTYFDGSGNQTIPQDLVLQKLILGGGGTKTAAGNLVINQDFNLLPGVTFDAGSASAVDTFKGQWSNSGAILPHGGLVVFKSPGFQSITGTNVFSDLEFAGTGTKIVSGDLTINGNITIHPSATVQCSATPAQIKGTWVNNGTFDGTDGTVTLNGAGAQSLTGNTTFNNLTLGGGNTKTANDPLTINGTMTVRSATTFDPGPVTHHLQGDLIIDGTLSTNAGTLIFNGTHPQVIDGDAKFNNVTVANDSGARLVSALGDTIHGTLNFVAGRLRLGSSDLTLQPSATVTGAAKGQCINTNGTGRVRRRIQGGASAESFVFPIAPDKDSYNPLLIVLHQDPSEPTETFSVRVEPLTGASIGFVTLDTSYFVKRVWTIEEETVGGNRVNLAFQWDSDQDGANIGIDPGNPVQASAYLYVPLSGQYERVTDAVGPPHLNNPVVAATLGYVATSFGSYVIGDPAPLPIALASFTGTALPGGSVSLNWKTLSEINNYGFYVQRKETSAAVWTDLSGSFVPGHGTTATPHDYVYTDGTATPGELAYRLRQVDTNGASYFTGAINVSITTDVPVAGLPAAFDLGQNYPNPFNPVTNIAFSLPAAETVSLKVFDVLGREVSDLIEGPVAAGSYTIRFDVSHLASGAYIYRLVTPTHTAVMKLVVLK